MLTTFVSLQQGNVKKSQKICKNGSYWRRKPSYLLNDVRNFIESFRKDVAYDNIKSQKKTGFHALSRKHILEKPQGDWVKLTRIPQFF